MARFRTGRFRTGAVVAVLTAGVMLAVSPMASAAPATGDGLKHCAVSDGRQPETATPEEVGVDSAALREAVTLASDPTRFTFQVFRNNCLIAGGPNNQQAGGVAWNLWSSTKSVVSMVTGVAVSEGKLRVDDPIDSYLPAGLGDSSHRAITIRSLLTETSGMEVAVASEGVTGLVQLDPNVVAQALGMPIVNPQGAEWQYSQRAIDLLAYVVQRAVGEDFQAYAQRKLFDPLGIRQGDYHWARDRSDNTYGYAHLVLPPNDFAKLGLLLTDNGNWHGNQLISTAYLDQARTPTEANPCYGFLFTVNGPGCDAAFPGLPKDAYQMSGMMRQDNFIVPSLGLLVSWTGITVPGGAVSFPHDVLRALTGAFRSPTLADPGPYQQHPDISLADPMIMNPDATYAALGLGPMAYPGCGFLSCLGAPLTRPFADWPAGCFILGCVGADPGTPGIR
ncbi:serine hydrolase domain-containing protein [Nocardia jejuensis]|uniref:serine hydrolase domain-containing protein n=1 Tax=Nocardia jejuensis TaxID=328049 RepID=UPI000AF11B71|nr:serine hydrolase [Nocardia jejuensis]